MFDKNIFSERLKMLRLSQKMTTVGLAKESCVMLKKFRAHQLFCR